jgi:hypothetical protein
MNSTPTTVTPSLAARLTLCVFTRTASADATMQHADPLMHVDSTLAPAARTLAAIWLQDSLSPPPRCSLTSAALMQQGKVKHPVSEGGLDSLGVQYGKLTANCTEPR